jgi:alanine dehydrogenase
MRLINNDEVNQVLRMADCIRVQEEAFRGLVEYGAVHRPRVDLYYPAEEPESYFRWGSMEGASSQYFAIRMKSDIVSWPKTDDGGWTEEKHCIEPGTYCGLIFLLSTKNGEPLALINDGLLQHFRVGGGAGIGAKYLSREDSEVVGLIGSGGMARTFLDAFCCVRPIKECRVFSPTKGHKEAFAEEMSDKLGIRVVAVSGPQEAIAGADIVSSATDSMVPVYDAAWLEEGQHVTNLGRREMPEEAISRFDVVVRQGVAGLQMKQTDIFQAERGHSPAAFIGGTAEQQRVIPAKNPSPGFGGDSPEFMDRGKGGDKPELKDLVTGQCEGRTTSNQITFYRNVGNQGLQFSSVGGLVYEKIIERNMGRDIPTDWLLQDIRD